MDLILLVALVGVVGLQALIGLQMDRFRRHLITLVELTSHAVDMQVSRRAQNLHDELGRQ